MGFLNTMTMFQVTSVRTLLVVTALGFCANALTDKEINAAGNVQYLTKFSDKAIYEAFDPDCCSEEMAKKMKSTGFYSSCFNAEMPMEIHNFPDKTCETCSGEGEDCRKSVKRDSWGRKISANA